MADAAVEAAPALPKSFGPRKESSNKITSIASAPTGGAAKNPLPSHQTQNRTENLGLELMWRCWCSAVNSATRSNCALCTTPRSEQELVSPNFLSSEESKGAEKETEAEAKTGEAQAGVEKGGDRKLKTQTVTESSNPEALTAVLELGLVVRSDLRLGPGKIAEQCCLASLSTVWHSREQGPQHDEVRDWLDHSAAKKRFFACDSPAAMAKLEARAAVCGVSVFPITIEEEKSVLAVGPAPPGDIDLLMSEQITPFDWKQHAQSNEGQGMQNEELARNRVTALTLFSQVVNIEPPKEIKKIKPNAKCHCGLGKKYKKCCAVRDREQREQHTKLRQLIEATLGKDSRTRQHCNNRQEKQHNQIRGERVLTFRKQGEYGAKKYIKP